MRLAIFTPSHDLRWLPRARESIRRACTLLDPAIQVQWRVLLNGEACSADKVAEVLEGPHGGFDVVAHMAKAPAGNVGALKREACDAAIDEWHADVLVELDHDDELQVECLLALVVRFEQGAEFVTSYTAGRTRFDARFGWDSYSTVVNGQRLWVHPVPEPCARSLFEIFYAPNHVRAWSRECYRKAGGHDERMAVADDHDLLCRTYLAGARMEVIQSPLYVQHEGTAQTQLVRNAEIQRAQAEVGAKHLYGLAREQARRRGQRCVDLGGALGSPEGYLSLDKPGTGADVEHDVTSAPLPFETDSVGVIRAHDFLEHVEPQNVVGLMNELYRVLAPGGWLLTSTPSTDGRGAWQDPTHRSGWNSNSWWYYSRAEQARYVPQVNCRFQVARVANYHPSPWHELHNIVYCDAALWALKGQPQIGEVLI